MKIKFPKIDGVLPIAIPFKKKTANLITANIYALGKGPIILIDTGFKFPGAIDFIEEKLNLAGFGFDDIEKILLTHGHVDHFGLVMGIRKAAKRSIPCFLHRDDRLQVSEQHFLKCFWSSKKENFLIQAGVPESEIQEIKSGFSYFKNLADPVKEFLFLEDKNVFSGNGYNLEVIHTPGHSPGSCCLYERNKKILFTGDVVIGHITPNPFVETDKACLNLKNYQSLAVFMKSLEKLMKRVPEYVFSGHGRPIENLSDIILFYLEHSRKRIDFVENALKKKPGPIYPLIKDVFPNIMYNEDLFMAVSDLFAHLEVLISQDRAMVFDQGPPVKYRVV